MVAKTRCDVQQPGYPNVYCGVNLEHFDVDEPDVDEPCRSLVGHLMWPADNTRPNILNATRAVVRYSHAPKRAHWLSALHAWYEWPVCNTFQRGLGVGQEL